jgi:hypothetical protein
MKIQRYLRNTNIFIKSLFFGLFYIPVAFSVVNEKGFINISFGALTSQSFQDRFNYSSGSEIIPTLVNYKSGWFMVDLSGGVRITKKFGIGLSIATGIGSEELSLTIPSISNNKINVDLNDASRADGFFHLSGRYLIQDNDKLKLILIAGPSFCSSSIDIVDNFEISIYSDLSTKVNKIKTHTLEAGTKSTFHLCIEGMHDIAKNGHWRVIGFIRYVNPVKLNVPLGSGNPDKDIKFGGIQAGIGFGYYFGNW